MARSGKSRPSFAATMFVAMILSTLWSRSVLGADPTTFSIVNTQSGRVLQVHPNDEMRIRLIDGDVPANPADIHLELDGQQLAASPTIQNREVVFQLKRDDKNPALIKILGPPLDKQKSVSVGLIVNKKVLNYRASQLAADENPQAKIELLPAEPTSFAVLSDAGTIPALQLKDELKVRIDGDTPLPIEKGKIQARIDGDLLNVDPRMLSGRELVFPLVRNDNNRPLFARLLGSPFSGKDRTVQLSIEINGKPLKYTEAPRPDEAKEAKITIIAYDRTLMTVGIISVIVVVIVSFLMAALTTLIRDPVIPQLRRAERPFSLGRLQMLFWLCLILSSFLFIFVVTFDVNSITAESFVLMGISASTALASVAIDRSKADPATGNPVSNAKSAVDAMNIKSCADVKKLFEAHRTNGTAAATIVIPGATVPGITDPTVDQLWDAYQGAIARIKSSRLLADLVNDAAGPTIHRWQIVIWTLVLGAIHIATVYTNLETPSFGTNLLALMGISGGVYLGFKIPERQG